MVLSDGKLLFWWTGDECHTWQDFYKDFFYAGISMWKYETEHRIELIKKQILTVDDDTTSEEWNLAFDGPAKEFYRQYEISPDSRGQRPY